MPKKFDGENTKSAQARARKDAVRKAEIERKEKEAEDKLWEDNDKHVLKKLERKEEKERKEQEKLQRKQESQRLLDEEMSTLKSAKPVKPEKVTRYQIEMHKEKEQVEKEQAAAKAEVESSDSEIEENLNRLQLEHESARNVDEALKILGGDDKGVDMHPEKRMKAAYLEFEAENLPILKQENPNMRLSQLKQLLKKDWMKSPKNPLVQAMMKQNV